MWRTVLLFLGKGFSGHRQELVKSSDLASAKYAWFCGPTGHPWHFAAPTSSSTSSLHPTCVTFRLTKLSTQTRRHNGVLLIVRMFLG